MNVRILFCSQKFAIMNVYSYAPPLRGMIMRRAYTLIIYNEIVSLHLA